VPNWPTPLNPTGKKLTAIFEARHCHVRVLALTPPELHVLLLVEKLDESAFPAGIPRWMMPRPATIPRLLDCMEDEQLVARLRNPDNEEAKHVVMTRKGEGGSGVRPGRLPLCTLATSSKGIRLAPCRARDGRRVSSTGRSGRAAPHSIKPRATSRNAPLG